ncbi:VanZ family protein [Herbiconiux sp. SYSU D00978]|uniref:VanZ family protein n=1 Tax=Herbiconiux sp. SYSU D00978 TaxID=2812562 RepID=UPI001A95ECF4|nr:VanZ family protein [Herbiconiux sp. SYSU D00978]
MLRRAVLTGLVAYCLLVVVVLLWPTPVDAPLAGPLDRVIAALQRRGLGWVTYERIEFAANVALFAPIGLLGGMLVPRRAFVLPILLAAATSALFEFTQGALLADRTASALDVAANTIGATIGVLTAMLPVLRRRPRHPKWRRQQLDGYR